MRRRTRWQDSPTVRCSLASLESHLPPSPEVHLHAFTSVRTLASNSAMELHHPSPATRHPPPTTHHPPITIHHEPSLQRKLSCHSGERTCWVDTMLASERDTQMCELSLLPLVISSRVKKHDHCSTLDGGIAACPLRTDRVPQMGLRGCKPLNCVRYQLSVCIFWEEILVCLLKDNFLKVKAWLA